jgi:hypothetical protein
MRSAKSALQRAMSPAEHSADRPPDDRSEDSQSWFDFHRVTHDAAAGIVQQAADFRNPTDYARRHATSSSLFASAAWA